MIGISVVKSAKYYMELAQNDDYYHKGKEPAGKWYGKGAEHFRLTGEVNKQDFYALCAGVNPHNLLDKLVRNARDENRRIGWDMTFNAPKSISAIWATADENTRKLISQVHDQALKKTLDYYAENYGRTRVGKTGTETDPTNKLIFALFEHSTSRALDPHLHTHAVMMNVAINPRGETRTLQTLDLYDVRLQMGAYYRAELAYLMRQNFRVAVEAGKAGTFEIKDVPKLLMDFWSKRRKEIEAELKRVGFSGGRASEIATLNTRQKKEYPDREILFSEWAEKGKEYGFDYKTVLDKEKLHRKDEAHRAEILKEFIVGFTRNNAYFSDIAIRRGFLEIAPVCGFTGDEGLKTVNDWLKSEAVPLGMRKGKQYYTTQEIDRIEKQMLEGVKAGQDYQPRTREKAVSIREDLSGEQKEAVNFITETKGQFKVVRGIAGAGKTTMLNEARKVWEAQGYEIRGASLQATTVKDLERETTIKSSTIAQLLIDIEREKEWNARLPEFEAKQKAYDEKAKALKLRAEWLHATHQIDGTTKKKMLGEYWKPVSKPYHEFLHSTWQISKEQKEFLNARLDYAVRTGQAKFNLLGELKDFKEQKLKPEPEQKPKGILHEKTVLVIDEAGMVGTMQMQEIVKLARESGAKVVMVGDEKQIQAIEHGAPFKAIGDTLGKVELKEIRRQRELWAREAVMHFADGEAEKALKKYADKGFLHVQEDRGVLVKELVGQWWQDQSRASEKMILGTTNADVRELNEEAQKMRKIAGELGSKSIDVNGATIYEKDRVMFTKNLKSLGLINGEFGEVKEINEKRNRITIRLDDGQMRTVPLDRYKDVVLGYAITTHKAQGKTFESTCVLTGSAMQDRELTYVQASRARGTTRIFATFDQMDTGELTKMMNKSNQKLIAQQMREQEERSIAGVMNKALEKMNERGISI